MGYRLQSAHLIYTRKRERNAKFEIFGVDLIDRLASSDQSGVARLDWCFFFDFFFFSEFFGDRGSVFLGGGIVFVEIVVTKVELGFTFLRLEADRTP